MKISIIVNGTRGDVQPMLALSKALINRGHEVLICAPQENEELVKRYQVPFESFGPNYRELFKKNANMKGGATTSPSIKEMKAETGKQISQLPGIMKGSDLVLGVGFVLGVHTAAGILKIPYRFFIFYPVLLGTTHSDPLLNRMLFGFGRSMTNMAMKSFINKKRVEAGLNPVGDVWGSWMGEHVIVACDRELNAAREGVAFRFTQTGYMPLQSEAGLPAKVEAFLGSGAPPVFITFGSNPVARPEKFASLFTEVAKRTSCRLIVSKGWADLPGEDNSADILYVDEMPYEKLFPKLAAIVHHGGTGTMAYAARAGIPQAAFPFMADQFENRKQVIKLGIGPKTCDFNKITQEALSEAIKALVENTTYREKASEIAALINKTNGIDLTVDLIEKEMAGI